MEWQFHCEPRATPQMGYACGFFLAADEAGEFLQDRISRLDHA